MKQKLRKLILFSALLLGVAYAQDKRVSGNVSSSDAGEPLPGVSVLVQGVSTATQTDANGNFSLNVPENATSLIFRMIGFESQTITIPESGSLEVELVPSAEQLSEVEVVVPYGTRKLATFTGSAAQITSEQLAQRPLTNVMDAIVGAAPGVQTNSGSGQPGSGVSVRVRGLGSINASNDPLYVLDGVPYSGDIGSINVDDIESVTVLKDAATAALYGARAANGVIMITTKRGKGERMQTSVRALQGLSYRGIPEYDRIDAYSYYPLMWEAYRNSIASPGTGDLTEANQQATQNIFGLLGYNPFNVPNDQIVDGNGNLNPNASLLYPEDLDWADPVTRVGNRSDYSLSVNGATDKSDYLVSLGYLDEKGFLERSDYKRFTGRVNVNATPKSWFKTGLNIAGNMTRSDQASVGSSTGYVNPFFFARRMGPIYPVYAHDPATGEYLLDATGNRIYDLGNMGELGLPNRPSGANPGRHSVAETRLNNSLFNQNVLNARTYAEFKFLNDFTFTTNVALDVRNRLAEGYDNFLVGDGAPGGRASRTNTVITSYTFNQLLKYDKVFDKHHVTVLAGHENYDYKYDYLYGFKQGIIVEGNYELGNFATINNLTSRKDDHRIESYFSNLNYDFDEKYLFSASFRTDGSSRFAPERRWGQFWSFGAGWRLDNEDFLQNVSWLNMLKLRSTYGQLGNEDIGSDAGGYYAWQALYNIGPGYNNAAEPGFVQGKLASDLLWESINSFDVGLEFSMFNSRLNGTFEYFNRNTTNLLFSVPLPLTSGLEDQWQNVGNMYNRGFEIDLNGDLIRSRDFSWNMALNLSTLTNRITAMPQDEIIDGTKKRMVGVSREEFWLRQWYGVDPNTGAGVFIAEDPTASNAYELNGVMVTSNHNNAQFGYNGNAIPDLFGGMTNTLRYKDFSLSVLMNFQLGGQVYDGTYASLMGSGDFGLAMHVDMENRWQQPGDVTDVPRVDVTAANRTALGGAIFPFFN